MINVLIADSHPAARRALLTMVERLAERLGEECFVAFGEDAITTFRKAKRLQPDLILLSAPLPLATGVQAVAALREHTPNAKLAILLDDKSSFDPDRYEKAGADVVLLKGDDTLEIEAGLKTLLNSDPGRR
jgi:DNA-binding NarL/FixJ family response regulator